MRLLEGMEFLYAEKFYLSQVALFRFVTLWALKSVRIPKMASLPKKENTQLVLKRTKNLAETHNSKRTNFKSSNGKLLASMTTSL